MAAKVPNPRKQFQFRITMFGLNQFLAQEVKLPDEEFDIIEHGDTDYDVKTAGRPRIGTLTITKLEPGTGPDTFVRTYRNMVRTGLPSMYKKTCLIEEFAPDGRTVIDRHEYEGVWLSKINGKEFSRTSSNNTTQSLEFSVDNPKE